jgi:hypothetical protein
MKKLILLAMLAFVNDAFASRIVKFIARGGTPHPDGTVTYYTVDQNWIGHGKNQGWKLKCLDGGSNHCAITSTGIIAPGSEGIDAYDVQIANQMIITLHQQLTQGVASGSITQTFLQPDGTQRTYIMTWQPVVAEDGTIQTEMELIRQ